MHNVGSVIRAVSPYSLSHLSDVTLLKDLATIVAQDRNTTATLLAHIGEVDARKLYAPAGYSSMHVYCVEELGLSDDAAYKRIQAARAARQFPILFAAVADGRLHLTAITLIAPHLTADNVDVLIATATHRRKSEIEDWLVAHGLVPPIDRARYAPVIRPVTRESEPAASDEDQLALEQVDGKSNEPELALEQVGGKSNEPELALEQVGGKSNEPTLALEQVDGKSNEPELALGQVRNASSPPEGSQSCPPLQPSHEYLVRVVIDRATHDKLRRAQVLLSHSVPLRDVAQLLGRALDALIAQLEKRKLGTGSAEGPGISAGNGRSTKGKSPDPDSEHPSTPPRRRRTYIPSEIRRAVWERDGGQCTFVSESGRRCTARGFLEFDHVEPVARGGKASIVGLRLRCRAHNQYEAERAFGANFMKRKRAERATRRRKS